MSAGIYIRLGKQTRGPFDQAQLQRMAKLGQFGRLHEVSEDRQRWRSAGALIDGWTTRAAPAESNPRDAISTPAGRRGQESNADHPFAGGVPTWFHLTGGAQVGPKTTEEIRAAIAAGTVKRNALVWREGLADWAPADRFPEFMTAAARSPNRGPLWLAVGFLAVSGVAFAAAAWQKGWFDGILSTTSSVHTVGGESVALLSLPDNASAAQVTSAYRSRVYHLFIRVDPWTMTLVGQKFPIRGGAGTGSGIALAHNGKISLIATNRHVVCPDSTNIVGDVLKLANLERDYYTNQVFEGGRRVRVKQPDWLEPRNARIAAVHRERDLAVVLLEMDGAAPFATKVVSRSKIEQGERAVALGNPLGLEFFTTDGLITSARGQGGFVWTNCSLSSGNSGGPLLLSRRGLLVGLNTLASGQQGAVAQNLNAAEPLDEAVRSLTELRNDAWYWNPTLKELTAGLAKLVPVVNQ